MCCVEIDKDGKIGVLEGGDRTTPEKEPS